MAIIREYQRGGAIDTPDAFMASNTPDTNYGAPGTNEIQTFWNAGAGTKWRTILKFDVSDIPTWEEIQTAELQLYVKQAASTAYSITIYVLSQNGWVELECTWNIYAATLSWTAAGGDYYTSSPAGVASTLATSTGVDIHTGLGSLVQWAKDHNAGQLILLIKGTDEATGTDGNVWHDSEHITGSFRPLLRVVSVLAPSKTTYQPTDTPVTMLGACSGLTPPGGADAVLATVGGTPGTTTFVATVGKDETQAIFGIKIQLDEPTACAAGRWGVNFETGATGDYTNLVLEEVWICLVNSSDTNKATVASLTTQPVSLEASTEYGFTLFGNRQEHEPGDYAFVVLVISNMGSLSGSDVSFIPSLTIETPYVQLLQTAWFLPTDENAGTENDWTVPDRVLTLDTSFMSSDVVTNKQDVGDFEATLPADAVVYGVEARVYARAYGDEGVGESAGLGLRISGDGGITFSLLKDLQWDGDESPYESPMINVVYGGPDHEWGHGPWQVPEFDDVSFLMRAEHTSSVGGTWTFGRVPSDTHGVDNMQLRISYTSSAPAVKIIGNTHLQGAKIR